MISLSSVWFVCGGCQTPGPLKVDIIDTAHVSVGLVASIIAMPLGVVSLLVAGSVESTGFPWARLAQNRDPPLSWWVFFPLCEQLRQLHFSCLVEAAGIHPTRLGNKLLGHHKYLFHTFCRYTAEGGRASNALLIGRRRAWLVYRQ